MHITDEDKQHEYLFPERRVFYGGFWRRFLALFIDSIVLLPLVYIVRYFLGDSDGTLWSTDFFSFSGLIEIIIRWLYEALAVSGTLQATFASV